MLNSDLDAVLRLFNDKETNLDNIFEIYHSLIIFIISGKAISDMGHPDFYMGAINYPDYKYSSFSPRINIFQITKTLSKYLNNFDTNLIWYRDLSTWEKFCKFVMERYQIRRFTLTRKLIKSYKHYLRVSECPACGLKKYNDYNNEEEDISIGKTDKYINVNCRRCGKFSITTSAFKELDSFENKSKLYVYLSTREKVKKHEEFLVNPKTIRKIIE